MTDSRQVINLLRTAVIIMTVSSGSRQRQWEDKNPDILAPEPVPQAVLDLKETIRCIFSNEHNKGT